jgi:hypothetical protein
MQESRRKSVPYVPHDSVRRLSAPQHAASLMSELFRDPYLRVSASAIRDAIESC